MITPLLLAVLGLALLLGGAEGLVRGASALALRLGLTPLVVGLTVAAFGTSSPELVTSVGAALEGQGGLAVGNVVGSNICNVGLILGVAALIRPVQVHARLVRWDVPLMIGCVVLMSALVLDGHVGRLEGAVLVAGIVAYTGFTVYAARRSRPEELADFEAQAPPAARAAWIEALLLVVGLGLLVVGADLLVGSAVTIARAMDVSEATIGLTVVAVGTSLPELATSVVAALRGAADVAAGNVIGSNVFNVLAILGITALVQPVHAAGIDPVDLLVMTGLALFTLPLMKSGFRLSRLEGGLLLAAYVAYTAYLVTGS